MKRSDDHIGPTRETLPMKRFKEEKLLSTNRPTHMYEYWVTGSGPFPTDMLRHDSAWPADGDSAMLLTDDDRVQNRSIRLRSYRVPTLDRWKSFLWSVSEESLYSSDKKQVN